MVFSPEGAGMVREQGLDAVEFQARIRTEVVRGPWNEGVGGPWRADGNAWGNQGV